MNLQLEKINNYKIQVPLKQGNGNLKWKGSKLFNVRYWLLGLLGKKKSGKTSLIYSLIKYFASKNTIVMFFVSTFYIDDTYEQIRRYLEEHEITYIAFTSIQEDGVNNVNLWMKQNEKKDDTEEKEIELENKAIKVKSDEDEETEEEEEKDPEYLFVFDDISNEMRDSSVKKLCKHMRHFKAKIILSTQAISDIHPHIFLQMDYLALFKGFNATVLKDLFSKIQPDIEYPLFQSLYNKLTTGYDFMLIDRSKNEIRKNLDELVKI